MGEEAGHGPKVDNEEDVYRAITCKQWWVQDAGRPSSAAFDHEVFSVDRTSLTTAEESASRLPNVLILAKFNCGIAREYEFDTRDELDEAFPDNKAHAHVYFGLAKPLSNRQRKKSARDLAKKCKAINLK